MSTLGKIYAGVFALLSLMLGWAELASRMPRHRPDGEALSSHAAWTIFGVGVGQAQIVGTGITLAIVLVVGYRLLTRGRRYVPSGQAHE